MTLQALFICVEIDLAALVYSLNKFIPFPEYVSAIAAVDWILVHGVINYVIFNQFLGDTPIIYFLLNKSLRRSVLTLPGFKHIRKMVQKNTVTVPSKHFS